VQRAALARVRNTVPRQRILARFSALLAHVESVRRYDRCLFVSHSQGTVLATALLAQPAHELRIPGGSAALVTMGSPLRHLFAERLPVQFDWVCELADHPRRFVQSLQGPWYNLGADGDLIGRTVFSGEPDSDLLPPGRSRPSRSPTGAAAPPSPTRSPAAAATAPTGRRRWSCHCWPRSSTARGCPSG
jgi:hypothetical protein